MKRNILLFIILVDIICLVRVFFLNWKKIYEIKDTYTYGLTAPRGRIMDIKGNILVDNIGVKTLTFNRLDLDSNDLIRVSGQLAKIIDIDDNLSDYDYRYYYYINNKREVDGLVDNDILKKYKERRISSKDLLSIKLDSISENKLAKIDKKEAYIYYLMNNGYSFDNKIIKTNISDEEYDALINSNIDGINIIMTWERYYPYGSLLRDIFGNVSSYKQGIPLEFKDYYLDKGYSLNDRVGTSNLEYIYDDYLKGSKAVYKLVNNRLEKIKDEQRGKDIVLSIDIDLQKKLESIMEEEMINAKKGVNTKYYNTSYMIVSDPNTGEIISLIGKNIGKNNRFIDYSYYNVLNSFTVGSVVKGASSSVGYKYDLIDENTKVVDGCVRLYKQAPKCSWKSLGLLNDISAIKMSSNYFQYLIAIKLTGNEYISGIKLNANNQHFNMYRDVFKDYGLGTLTNIDLLNESTGIKGKTISDDLLLNMAIGQYDTYTPISLSAYINTLATGKRKRLSLLKYVLNDDSSIYFENKNEVLSTSPIDDKYLNRIREGLYAVNQSGTGYSYTSHKFKSAGKTGTAESFLDTNLDGLIDTRTTSTSYLMYAPYDKPKFSLAIVSPHIKYKNNISNYKYPINAKIVKRASDIIYNYLNV